MDEARQLHHIQVNIIRRLSANSPLKFSELHDTTLPNNIFAYHLKQLVSRGYVKRNEQGHYEPTRKALKTLSYSDTTMNRRAKSPLLLTMLYIQDSEGKILLTCRKMQPFPGYYGLPSGVVHADERIEDAARRELAEKTGIRSSRPIEYIGALDFRYLHSETNDIFVHAVAFVYKHIISNDTLQKLGEGDYIWSKLDHSCILPEVNAVKMMASAPVAGVTSLSFTEPTKKLSNQL